MSTVEENAQKDNLEWKRLELEQQRVRIEREKLAIEQYKARWTGISIFIPLLVIALTIIFNLWNQAQQARTDFALKAADIVLGAGTPSEAAAKAKALQNLFPERLPANFAESFRAKDYSGPSVATKKELLNLLIGHPDQKQEILRLWGLLFPADTWIEPLK
jgi:hypothetical protein